MNSDLAAGILYIVLLMILVGSALVARRLPLGKTLKMILAWVVIFAVVIVLFSFLVRP